MKECRAIFIEEWKTSAHNAEDLGPQYDRRYDYDHDRDRYRWDGRRWWRWNRDRWE